jgi:lantibiotic leader peptide-processing serine protease
MPPRLIRRIAVVAALSAAVFTIPIAGAPQQAARQRGNNQRFLVVARTAADVEALRAEVATAGGTVVSDLQQIDTLVVSGSDALRNRLRTSAFAAGVATDHVIRLIDPAHAQEMFNGVAAGRHAPFEASRRRRAIQGDPAFSLPGLMWNINRIDAPEAWRTTLGSKAVKVGVADTGLDFTHSELKDRVVDVVDFTTTEDPPICKTIFGFSDADLAAAFGGPEKTDWNGHGSWIGGNIGAALDTQGVNGIAPRVGLVALKISQWCGAAFDSEIIAAFLYAADHGIDVVNISFGGYLDRSDPDQDLAYTQYLAAVRYARQHGTTIVAAAGNEHARIGAGGLVLSHGSLTIPAVPNCSDDDSCPELFDPFGLYEVPGGIPGVIDVAATNNVVNASAPACAPGTSVGDFPVCKPASDPHQAKGMGRENQLAYYSNYGPRIDVAAPGGARKFNLPGFDRGGTPGFPYTDDDGFNVWQAFSTTSNWAIDIPCFMFTGGGFPADQCYSTIQGTSMAAPHAAAVVALIASRFPFARHRPALLREWLRLTATDANNRTQPLSATDMSGGDLTGGSCPTGYCHLDGAAISNREAYGAGVINARMAVDPF